MLSYVHCRFIFNSQNLDITNMFLYRGMVKENVAHLNNGVLVSCYKQGHQEILRQIGETRKKSSWVKYPRPINYTFYIKYIYIYIEQRKIKTCTYCMTYIILIKRICDIKRNYISIYRIDWGRGAIFLTNKIFKCFICVRFWKNLFVRHTQIYSYLKVFD